MSRATFDEGDKARRMSRALQDPQKALKQIGAMMVAESQAAFEAQRFGSESWKERGRVNTFGILSDFEAGRTPPSRRFERRPALRDTGRLASSIAFAVRSPVVEVGTNLPYANVHQVGGETTSARITPDIRRKLWTWLKQQSRDIRRQLGWLLNAKFRNESLTTSVPARPFVGITENTKRNVRRLIGVEIVEAK